MELKFEAARFSKTKKKNTWLMTVTTRHYSSIKPPYLNGKRERQKSNNNNNYNEETNFFPSVKPEENFKFLAYVETIQQPIVLKVYEQQRFLVYLPIDYSSAMVQAVWYVWYVRTYISINSAMGSLKCQSSPVLSLIPGRLC